MESNLFQHVGPPGPHQNACQARLLQMAMHGGYGSALLNFPRPRFWPLSRITRSAGGAFDSGAAQKTHLLVNFRVLWESKPPRSCRRGCKRRREILKHIRNDRRHSYASDHRLGCVWRNAVGALNAIWRVSPKGATLSRLVRARALVWSQLLAFYFSSISSLALDRRSGRSSGRHSLFRPCHSLPPAWQYRLS